MKPDPQPIDIVYEDDDVIVVNKPAHLATTSTEARSDCLAERVRFALQVRIGPRQQDTPHPTSRLDSPVTGLVTFAKNARTSAHLVECRKHGTYVRSYLTLAACANVQEMQEGLWQARIGVDPRNVKRRVVYPDATPTSAQRDKAGRVQTAESRFAIRMQHDGFVALDLYPQTGRTHQLRVHSAHFGMPILGDALYGGPRKTTMGDGTIIDFPRVLLHCQRVELPRTRAEPLIVNLPPPSDFQSVYDRLFV